jgi:hypothetical protein
MLCYTFYPSFLLCRNVKIKSYIKIYTFACCSVRALNEFCVKLREQYRLRVFENRLLSERQELIGDRRYLYKGELHDLYGSLNILILDIALC